MNATITALLLGSAMAMGFTSRLSVPDFEKGHADRRQLGTPGRGQDEQEEDLVTLVDPFRVESTQGELNVLQVRYSFPGRKYVVTASHGLVAAEGTLRFLSKANEVEFRDPESGKVIGVAKVGQHVKLMGGRNKMPIPRETDFPATSRTGKWSHERMFADNLNRTLNDHFLGGYLATTTEKTRIFITNYTQLENLNESKQTVRVAVMVTAPNDLRGTIEFKVFLLAHERRSRTDWRPVESDDAVMHAQEFVKRLTKRLAGEAE